MTDLVPTTSRIDRPALERIIRRAAELQAGARDIGDGLTEQDLLELGHEVGIPGAYLQQALLEEQTRTVALTEPGVGAWLAGPRQILTQRSISGESDRLQAALNHWMTQGELLTVKRRFPDRTSWEARQDVFSSLKRELKVGGRPYRLARAKEIVGRVTRLEDGRAHVQLLADLSNTRRSHLAGGATLGGLGAVATAVGLTLGVALPVALIPLGLGALLGTMVARRRYSQVERVHVALEQVLDRLEHEEVKLPGGPDGQRTGALERIAGEIRRSLGM
jgi:hypothetical protein